MAKMSDKYKVAASRLAAIVATAGVGPLAFHMRLYGRVLKALDGGELVLDVLQLQKAKAAKALLTINGGYLTVGRRTVTKVVCALRELPTPENITSAVFTNRGPAKSDPATAYVKFVFNNGKPHIAVNLSQSEKLHLKPEDMTTQGGPFLVQF